MACKGWTASFLSAFFAYWGMCFPIMAYGGLYHSHTHSLVCAVEVVRGSNMSAGLKTKKARVQKQGKQTSQTMEVAQATLLLFLHRLVDGVDQLTVVCGSAKTDGGANLLLTASLPTSLE